MVENLVGSGLHCHIHIRGAPGDSIPWNPRTLEAKLPPATLGASILKNHMTWAGWGLECRKPGVLGPQFPRIPGLSGHKLLLQFGSCFSGGILQATLLIAPKEGGEGRGLPEPPKGDSHSQHVYQNLLNDNF